MPEETQSTPEAGQTAAPQDERARRYNRIGRYIQVADFVLGWAWLAALLFLGWSAAFRDTAWAAGNYWLALALYMTMVLLAGKLLGLPLDYYGGHVIEHRFALSSQTLGSWLKDQLKGTALSLVLGIAAAELVYGLLRLVPDWWWLLAWAAFLLFVLALANLAPVLLFPLFYKFQPLEQEDLKERLLRLCQRAGTSVRGVFEWKLSEKSRKANAALAGWGNTRRIILADNLLAKYTPEEIEAVLAHELAHHVYHHIWKSFALQAAASLFGFWLANRSLLAFSPHFGFQSLSDFANFPLLAFASGVLSLLLLPVVNGVSRHFERQADDYALRAIPSTVSFISSMEKLAADNLAERRPNPVIEFLFHSHPSIEKRIQRATASHGRPGV